MVVEVVEAGAAVTEPIKAAPEVKAVVATAITVELLATAPQVEPTQVAEAAAAVMQVVMDQAVQVAAALPL
jgi:CO dehydrogenase/acetyl-CoA synthase delta subunit